MRPIHNNNTFIKAFHDLVDQELNVVGSPLYRAKANILSLTPRIKGQKNVIAEIKADFKKFILKSPAEQQTLVNEWGNEYPNIFYGVPKKLAIFGKKPRPRTTSFGTRILKALQYESFRDKYAYLFTEYTGVRTCPYCNAMLVLPVVSERKTKSARYQLDHYFPKAKFPLLSISIFNLIPSCGQCNIKKSSGIPVLGKDFHLYAQQTPLECFMFKISNDSVINYYRSKSNENIKINFNTGPDGTYEILMNHNDVFNIIGLYNELKDVAEELLWMSIAYDETRIKELCGILNLPSSIIRRMILGNYTEKDEIHKRPLAKFQQDLARQLKIIP